MVVIFVIFSFVTVNLETFYWNLNCIHFLLESNGLTIHSCFFPTDTLNSLVGVLFIYEIIEWIKEANWEIFLCVIFRYFFVTFCVYLLFRTAEIVCLFVCLCVCLFVYLYVYLFVCLFVCLFVYSCICMFICLSVCLFVCSCICLFVCSFVYFVCLFVYLFVCVFVCLCFFVCFFDLFCA
jgi:hypothetical protein